MSESAINAIIAYQFIKIVILLFLYFIPFCIAVDKKHKKVLTIFIINLSLGWTIIVWFLVLAWACNGDTYQKSIAEKADEIKKIAELKEKGALTEEEFNTQKNQILNS